jgi:polyhydroxyalkanoate synthesis repressor PhaR
MANRVILIKKYENRRLYDTTNSRYVNLEDVARLLQRGEDVRVADAVTGEDITRLILTQIIVEDAKTPDSTFPLDMLRQMVIATGQASQESALKYMKAMLDIYQNAYRAMVPPMNPFEFLQEYGSARSRTAAAPAEASPSPFSPRPASAKQPDNAEVAELKQRVAELEKMVSSLSGKKPQKTRRRN